jgi:hypothetical protein
MSSANVDLVRSIFAAWERGDFSSSEWAHAEIEFVIADGPTPGSWTGAAGMTGAWRGFLSAWEEFRTGADEYRELDHERARARPFQRARQDQRAGSWADTDGGSDSLPCPLRQGDEARRLLRP